MPNGKPGDNPYTDFFVHRRPVFPPDIARMLRAIHRYDESLLEPFRYPAMWHWERGEHLDEGRRHLLAIIREYGITAEGIE